MYAQQCGCCASLPGLSSNHYVTPCETRHASAMKGSNLSFVRMIVVCLRKMRSRLKAPLSIFVLCFAFVVRSVFRVCMIHVT